MTQSNGGGDLSIEPFQIFTPWGLVSTKKVLKKHWRFSGEDLLKYIWLSCRQKFQLLKFKFSQKNLIKYLTFKRPVCLY